MHIVEFLGGTLRFLESVPTQAPAQGFIWIYLDRASLPEALPVLQSAAQRLGGSPLLDLHVQDLVNPGHPSHYDSTSIYDLVVFRRLATHEEIDRAIGKTSEPQPGNGLESFRRIDTRAVGFAVFDRLLITVHPEGCFTAKSFVQRYLTDAVQNDGLVVVGRSRLPTGPGDLMLRMVNVMVDSYLELRKQLSGEMDRWQEELLGPGTQVANWSALMVARSQLHALEDLCEEQNDAMQEWLDTALEQPPPGLSQADRDGLVARARDVIEHIQRVVHQVRRMEQGAESVVQIHFSAQSHRTNEIMRVLTALTAIFLPLNFITGFFGMNFEHLPFLSSAPAMWLILLSMPAVVLLVVGIFWRKRYLARSAR